MLVDILPDDIITLILSEWISLEDLVRFDSAVCNKVFRSRYLDITKIFSSPPAKDPWESETVYTRLVITTIDLEAFGKWKLSRNVFIHHMKVAPLLTNRKKSLKIRNFPELKRLFFSFPISEMSKKRKNINVNIPELLNFLPNLEELEFQDDDDIEHSPSKICINIPMKYRSSTIGKTINNQVENMCPNLRKLNFLKCNFSVHDVNATILGDCLGSCCPQLQDLHLIKCEGMFPGDVVPHILSKLPSSLHTLAFYNLEGDGDSQFKFESHLLLNLAEQLAFVKEPPLSSQPMFPHLKVLSLGRYFHITHFRDIAILLKACPNLISFQWCFLNSNYEQRFDYLVTLWEHQILANKPHLKKLRMDMHLSDDDMFVKKIKQAERGLVHIPAQYLALMRAMDPHISSHNFLTDVMIYGMRNLESLADVICSNLRDHHLTLIAQVCQQLKYFDCFFLYKITDEGVASFCAQFAGDKEAFYAIDIYSCAELTIKSCKKLLATFPNLRIFNFVIKHGVHDKQSDYLVDQAIAQYRANQKINNPITPQ